MIKKTHIFLLLLSVGMASCHYTRYVPEGKKILWDNKITVNENKKASGAAENILKQQPNSKVGFNFLRPALAVFSWGNGTDTSFWGKLGEAPVIFDSVKASTGADQLSNYYFNKGYFNAQTSYKIQRKGKKKAEVEYFVTTGERYFIDTITYEIATKNQDELRKFFGRESVLYNDMPYDGELLDEERERLVNIYRNHGYYDFQKTYINYTADTVTPGDHRVIVKMIIGEKPVRQGDSIAYQPFEQYYMHKVIIRPDYDYKTTDEPSDSTYFRKYELKYDSLRYKPRYLTDAIHFNKGSLYNQRDIRDTYSHLSSYQAFDASEIVFRPGPRDTAGPTLIAEVRLRPQQKRTFSTDLETTLISTQRNPLPGINASISTTNRNLFGGGEALQIKVLSGYEAQPVIGSSEFRYAFEVGAEVNLKFPRFLLPFNTIGLLPKRMRPHSQVSLYANHLTRNEFDRTTVGAALSYLWKESNVKSHEFTLWNLSYSSLKRNNDAFFKQLNPIQDLAFQSEFISSTQYRFTFNQKLAERPKRNNSYFTTSIEIAGTLQNLIAKNTSLGRQMNEDEPVTMFDIPYYQFVKPDFDYRFYWNFYNKTSWVNRVYAGYIFPYGNSNRDTIGRLPPFSRFFFLGGTTDLRAWAAYRAGGGTSTITDYNQVDSSGYSIGTLKFLINSEYRFPIISSLQGAFFIDAGNMWLTGIKNSEPETNFKPESILNQLYIGSGAGIRLDLDFFVIRFDIGIKVRDPGYLDHNNGWVIDWAKFNNATYNFALGYPF